MKRGTTLRCLAFVLTCTAALAAQTQTQQNQQQQRQQPAPAAAQTVTLIGCIEPGATANTFVLNVLEQRGPAPSATAGRQPDATVSGQARVGDTQVGVTGQADITRGDTRATGTAGMNVVGQRLQLIGDARANLKAHVGHQVEVTGTLAPQTARQTAAETRLNVTSLRMISSQCPASTRGTTGVTAPGSVSQPQTQPRATAPSTRTQQQPATATGRAPSSRTMTVIGCVERGDAPNTFVLTVTEMPAGSAGGQPQADATAGAADRSRARTQGTTGASLVGQRLQLIGGNVASHIGHKVRISGTMMAPRSTTTGDQPRDVMRFNVSTVTMLAATCTPTTGAAAPGASVPTGTTGGAVDEQETPTQQVPHEHRR